MMDVNRNHLLMGIDIGSTTTKIVAADPKNKTIVYDRYERHGSAQVQSVREALRRFADRYPDQPVLAAMTGSGSKPVADAAGVPFIQEVVANSIALKELYEDVGTAIELGGQDAKMLFFRRDDHGFLQVADMRMNGSCAGGTGAFIDEIASIMKIRVEDFNALASAGDCVYDISGRCGVFAKTDIQPLLNQGVSKADLALSSFHAIAKQTIGGLAQGLEIRRPVVFEGGPLRFNPELIRVFSERLDLKEEDILIPPRPEVAVAYGAALSLQSVFENPVLTSAEAILESLEGAEQFSLTASPPGQRYFDSLQDRRDFEDRQRHREVSHYTPSRGEVVSVWLGMDSGSTTTKFVLLDRDGNLMDSFYSANKGDPLIVARDALIQLRDHYREAGAELEILGVGTTGYGELLFNKAFHTEHHVVETVAHARAADEYIKDASFILDIGGQDMKAIWLDGGIITNIVVNEACSSGCGSFLENFASNLGIAVEDIAEAAFSSSDPAVLGSRCTVFMNSSIITEQRNGRQSGDIMAGLCRSIIENVFTKVIRVSNLDSLGDRIVVQGGTFENDAVLRAMEQYVGRPVIRAPYPGIMGAIGAALLTKERMEAEEVPRSFIGLDALEEFSFSQESNAPCPFCANHCKRTIVRFSDGSSWITNNRCERGEILGDPADAEVREKLRAAASRREKVPDLYELRKRLLFQNYPISTQKDPDGNYRMVPPDGSDGDGSADSAASSRSGIAIGLPRVLQYWDTMPFWSTFWRSLGFRVIMSPYSTREIYESGISAIPSDTVCFPAKLVHGHLRSLAGAGADRIFMPSVTVNPTENTDKHSESMCAVVKGYPIVIRNSDSPDKVLGVPFDAPLFHWYTDEDRNRQLSRYMKDTFGIGRDEVMRAVEDGDRAMKRFRDELKAAAAEVLEDVKKTGRYAVVLASRPYQNDALVNHDLPSMFTSRGIPVLTADSLPGAEEVDLSLSRIDVVNNYHARMFTSAMLAARSEHLQYVQVVSFGCGHDAYLSDEIIRLMNEISGKAPLVLKLDESDVQGPLGIRVRSFLETVEMKKQRAAASEALSSESGDGDLQGRIKVHPLKDPYPVKFEKEDRKERTVLIPNSSHAFSRIMSAALSGQKIRAVPLDIGRDEAIRLGKKYVHNDICFPAQVVIGEVLAELESGKYDPEKTAVGMGKYIGDCRLTHYGSLLRKALDDAGYEQVPVLTNDDEDYHNMHPGFRMNLLSAARIAIALPMIDVLEELLRKIRPYELTAGSAGRAFEYGMDQITEGLTGSLSKVKRSFSRAVEAMRSIDYDRSEPKKRVLIVGEYLLNFHPGANRDIELYLEKNGFEIIEARMTDVIRKTYFYKDAQNREYHLSKPAGEKIMTHSLNRFFDAAHRITDRLASAHPLYEKATRMQDLVKGSDDIIHHTFDAGEGVLIPGEIIHHAEHGCRNFIILQPFGCLPNHIVGRGIMKKLKERYPDCQILPLDYDPDISYANIENRLQMLIMNAGGGN